SGPAPKPGPAAWPRRGGWICGDRGVNAPLPRPKVPLPFDLARIRADFPILAEPVRGGRLAYLDNGATTQKPEPVLRAMDHYYRHQNSNVHRAVHDLAERATTAYEGARDRIARYLGAAREEIVFTRGTTEAI